MLHVASLKIKPSRNIECRTQTIGDLVSKETVCCVGEKVKC